MPQAKRVLLVDDSITTAKQLERIIEGCEGFEVAGHARNGAEAIKQFQELRPDIVCMDIVMPVMSGLQALRGILAADGDARVVLVSSLGDVGDKVVEALNAGAKAVVAKPLDPEKLLCTLKRL